MKSGKFRLVGLDNGDPGGAPEHCRLVCMIEGGGKLAIWGQEAPVRNLRNIEAVQKAGMPCTVECEYREPGEKGVQYGHTHWVRQDFTLRVLPE